MSRLPKSRPVKKTGKEGQETSRSIWMGLNQHPVFHWSFHSESPRLAMSLPVGLIIAATWLSFSFQLTPNTYATVPTGEVTSKKIAYYAISSQASDPSSASAVPKYKVSTALPASKALPKSTSSPSAPAIGGWARVNPVEYVKTHLFQQTRQNPAHSASPTSNDAIANVHGGYYRFSPFILHYNRQLSPHQARYLSAYLNQFADQFQVPAELIASIVAVESSFRHDAISSSGAIGLGQLKPETAQWLGVQDPYDPVDNLQGTTRYLSYLLQRFNGETDKAIAAYYQGQGSVDRNGIAPASLTYIERVKKAYGLIASMS